MAAKLRAISGSGGLRDGAVNGERKTLTSDYYGRDYSADLHGVYQADGEDRLRLIHRYTGEDYRLSDILDFFELGELVESVLDGDNDEPGLVLDGIELVKLSQLMKMANQVHPIGFITMCEDIVGHNQPREIAAYESIILYANF